jgi:hypothetical protein
MKSSSCRLEGQLKQLRIGSDSPDVNLSLTVAIRNVSESPFTSKNVSDVEVMLIPVQRTQTDPVFFLMKRKASTDIAYSSELDIDKRLTIRAGGTQSVPIQMGKTGVYAVNLPKEPGSARNEREIRLTDIAPNRPYKVAVTLELVGDPVRIDSTTQSTLRSILLIEQDPAVFIIESGAYVLRQIRMPPGAADSGHEEHPSTNSKSDHWSLTVQSRQR